MPQSRRSSTGAQKKGVSKLPEAVPNSSKAPHTDAEGLTSPPASKRKRKDSIGSPTTKAPPKLKEKSVAAKPTNKAVPPTVVMSSPVAEATLAAADAAAAVAEQPSYPCGICQREVQDDDEATLCESQYGCQRWFHRHCTGLTRQAYNMLTTASDAQWVCDQCVSSKSVPWTCPKDT